MKLSVIIPVYNAIEDVKKCLNSVEEFFDKSQELIIVDDCSQDETKTYLEEFVQGKDYVKLFRNQENLGFVKTCNFGMKQTKGEVVVLLNSDTMIPKRFCEKIITAFDVDKKIGIACPIASNGGYLSMHQPEHLTLEDVNNLLDEKHVASYPRLSSCHGFCFCMRRNVMEEMNGLDEAYGRGYHEEVDFCYRAITAGYECALIDNLYVFHKHHASFGTKQRSELMKRNDAIFQSRWKGFVYKWHDANSALNPIEVIQNDIYGKIFKIFKRVKRGNYREIYFLGIKLYSYKSTRMK